LSFATQAKPPVRIACALFKQSALGVPIEIDRGQRLTKFQFHLGLTDALNYNEHAASTHLKELLALDADSKMSRSALGIFKARKAH